MHSNIHGFRARFQRRKRKVIGIYIYICGFYMFFITFYNVLRYIVRYILYVFFLIPLYNTL